MPSVLSISTFITGISYTQPMFVAFLNFIAKHLVVIKTLYLGLFILRDVEHNKLNKAIVNHNRKTILIVAIVSTILFLFSSLIYYLYFLDLLFLLVLTVSINMFIRSLGQKSKYKLGVDKQASNEGVSIATNKGFFNIPQPTRGIIGIAGAGGGKTASLVRPLIRNSLEKHYSIFAYDYKFPDISGYLYTHLKRRGELHKFKCINFDDLTRTHRVNPVHPRYIQSKEAVAELCDTIGRNLMDDHSSFWFSSLVLYLQAVLVYLRNRRLREVKACNGDKEKIARLTNYCTLPYLISICLDERVENIVAMCQSDFESKDLIGAMFVAIEEGAGGQKAGVIGTVCTYINKLNTKSIFFVLSGDEVDLVLNYDKETKDPTHNRILCVGNTSEIQSAIKPVIALITQCSIRVNNVEQKNEDERNGRMHYVLLIDEFPTLQLLDIEQLPATGRSRKIITFLLAQDLSQIIRDYGKERCNAIIANCANFFLGNCGSIETNETGMRIFGKRKLEKESTSISQRSNDMEGYSTSQSTSEQKDYIVEPHELNEFPPGLFLGKLVSTKKTFYKGRVKYVDEKLEDIPSFRDPNEVSRKAVSANYKKIKKNARLLVDSFQVETSNDESGQQLEISRKFN